MSEAEQAAAAAGAAPSSDGAGGELSFVYDVPVTLQVLLGEATMTIGDVLKCGKGSVIPLNQKVDAPFTLLLQKRPIAEGEVVEAGGQIGIKITKVLRANGDTSEEVKQGEAT